MPGNGRFYGPADAALQTLPGGQTEADFASLGGNFISSPAVLAHDEVIEVFGIQADRAMYSCTTHRTPLGDVYGDWTSLGGIFTSAPTAVSGGLGQVDVFARDANFQLAHLSWNGTTWSDLENPRWDARFGTGRGELGTQPNRRVRPPV